MGGSSVVGRKRCVAATVFDAESLVGIRDDGKIKEATANRGGQ